MNFESKDDITARTQFKQLSFGKKAEYVWTYYKWYFIGAVLCILILLWALNHYILNPPPSTYTGIGFYNIQVTDDEIETLRNSLGDAVILPDENKVMSIASAYTFDEDPLYEDALRQRLDTMLLAKEIDIIIAPEEEFKTLSYSGYIVNIDECLTEEQLKIFKDNNEIFYNTNEQDSTTRPYGIKVNNSPYLKEISGVKLTESNIYLGFVRFNERQEQAAKTAETIYENIH